MKSKNDKTIDTLELKRFTKKVYIVHVWISLNTSLVHHHNLIRHL